MPSTFSANKGFELMATGEDNGTWGIKTNANLGITDLSFGGRFNIDVSGNTNVTVTANQAQNVAHVLTGVLTGSITYFLPATGAFYVISNKTTGNFSITIAMTGGTTSRGVSQGETMMVFVNPDANFGVQYISTSAEGRVGPFNLGVTGGSANAQTATIAGPGSALTAIPDGSMLEMIAGFSNTGATTLNINGQGALPVQANFGALTGGELVSAGRYWLMQSSATFQLMASGTAMGHPAPNIRVFSSLTPTVYTPSLGTRSIIVWCLGGGGGGGGVPATDGTHVAWGSGGGGGGFAIGFYTSGFSGQTVTVGAGGAAGAAVANGTGGNGGTSSFMTMSATGGAGGNGCTAQSSSLFAVFFGGGGVPGNATAPMTGLTFRGEPGTAGFGFPVNNQVMLGGGGGAAFFGGGNNQFPIGGGGFAATNANSFGAGGGGAGNCINQPARLGGTGFQGLVVIWEYF